MRLLLYDLQCTTTMPTTLTSQNSDDLVVNSDRAERGLNDQFATVDTDTSVSGGNTYYHNCSFCHTKFARALELLDHFEDCLVRVSKASVAPSKREDISDYIEPETGIVLPGSWDECREDFKTHRKLSSHQDSWFQKCEASTIPNI
jgi:hypothetical protein